MTVEQPENIEGGSPTVVATEPDEGARSPGEHRGSSRTGVWVEPEGDRSRRSLIRALAALGIAVASAVVLGLLIVAFSKAVGGGSSGPGAVPPALSLQSVGPSGSTVPADWVQQTSNSGIVFRAPPGWSQRSDSQIDYRVEPSASGPGQVGVGLVSASTDPNAAALAYATGTYSGQSSYLQQPPTDEVSARGEHGRQVVVTYNRSGTPVTVVVRAFPTSRGVLLIATRAPVSDPQRAERLADAVDASVQLQ